MEAVRGQKHPSEITNGKKELIYWKKYLIKVSQQLQKPLSGYNQIWATSDKKDTATSIYIFRVEVAVFHFRAAATAATATTTAITTATAFIGKNTCLTIAKLLTGWTWKIILLYINESFVPYI
jgi:hypothetical protein